MARDQGDPGKYWLAMTLVGVCVAVVGTVLAAGLLSAVAGGAAWLGAWGFPVALLIGLVVAGLVVWLVHSIAARSVARSAEGPSTR